MILIEIISLGWVFLLGFFLVFSAFKDTTYTDKMKIGQVEILTFDLFKAFFFQICNERIG